MILVNINPAYQPAELLYCLNKVGVAALVAAESFKSQNYYNLLSSVVPEVETSKAGQLASKAVPSLRHVILMTEAEVPARIFFRLFDHTFGVLFVSRSVATRPAV